MVEREIVESFRHTGRDPTIASSPKELRIGRVKEESVRLLQFVQICGHLASLPIQVTSVFCGPVSFELEDGDHIHVIYPKAALIRKTVAGGILPLPVRKALSIGEIFNVSCLNRNLQGNHPKDRIIDMMLHRNKSSFVAPW